MKFKKGDKVRILGKVFGDTLEETGIKTGDIRVIDETKKYIYNYIYVINGWHFYEQDLELAKPVKEKPVKVGDVIIENDSTTGFTVLEVLENIFSLRDIGYSSVHWMTFEELKEKLEDGGWRIKGEEIVNEEEDKIAEYKDYLELKGYKITKE